MSTERFKYNTVNYFFRHLFVIVLLAGITILFFDIVRILQTDSRGIPDLSTILYNKKVFLKFIYACPVLFVVSVGLLYLQIRLNTKRRFPFFKISTIITHPERYLHYTLEITTIVTLFILSISVLTSFYILKNKDIDTLRDFLANSSFVNMFAALFLSVWSLLITVIVMRQQRNEIRGFKRFLEEATLTLLEIYARTSNTVKKEKVYIVDFHPFIGCKTLGFENKYFNEYLEALGAVASSTHVELIIICHSEHLIKNKFSDKESIREFLNNNKKLSICKALSEIAKENKVTLWRSNEVGPYHFMIIGDEAIEYLVIPSNSIANENQLIATKTIDKSRIDYLERTAYDIVSASIKPISKIPNEVLDLTTKQKIQLVLKTEQENIRGIKLRFQFEEEDIFGNESVVNYKKGYFPDDKSKFFPFDNSNSLLLRQSTSNPDLSEIVYEFINNDVISEEVLFTYDAKSVYLENRHLDRSIVKNNTYLKIKIQNSNNLESNFSHKVEIKLW